MTKSLFLLSVLLLQFVASSTASATERERCSHSGGHFAMAGIPDVDERRPYDVLSYDLEVDLRRAFAEDRPVFSGKQTMKIKMLQAAPSIVIDAGMMTIDTVRVNGTLIAGPFTITNDVFSIGSLVGFNTGEEYTITISYTRTSAAQAGAYFFPKGTLAPTYAGIDTVLEDIFYTQSEPFDAHLWMPCNDLPYDKADASVTIRVPEGYVGISNGLLESTTTLNGSSTYRWKSDKPIATYLMVVNASKFVQWEDYYVRQSDPTDSVRCLYFAWEADFNETVTDGTRNNARYAFRNTARIIKEFSSKFGEYPFEQYGQVPVEPYWFGGMEHQSMTTVNRIWLRGRSELGIAHEIGHQWFGDKVTCETWHDLWLNEGFATFTEAIWGEANGGTTLYNILIAVDAESYLTYGAHDVSIYDVPPLQAFGRPYSQLVYSKAGAVIHLLRRLVNNDTLFFNAVRDYTDAFAYSTATTAKFFQFMSGRLGIDLTTFMDQWIMGPGHPAYSIGWAQRTNNELVVKVSQEQQWRDVFEGPMRFIAYFEDGTADTLKVSNDQRIQLYSFPLQRPVIALTLDSDYSAISTDYTAKDETLSVGVDAVHDVSVVRIGETLRIASTSTVESVIIHDAMGRAVREIGYVGDLKASLDVSDLRSGTYFVLVNTAGGQDRTAIQIVR